MPSRRFFIFSGIILIIGGVLALLMPFVASLTVTLIVGWAFLFAGAVHLWGAFAEPENRLWNAIYGLIELALGASFIFDPLAGMVSLTMVLGALFLASGILQLGLAYANRDASAVWVMALSGLISVALAVLIAFNLLAAATAVPGVLLGVEMLSTGIAFLLLRPRQIRDRAEAMLDGVQQG